MACCRHYPLLIQSSVLPLTSVGALQPWQLLLRPPGPRGGPMRPWPCRPWGAMGGERAPVLFLLCWQWAVGGCNLWLNSEAGTAVYVQHPCMRAHVCCALLLDNTPGQGCSTAASSAG